MVYQLRVKWISTDVKGVSNRRLFQCYVLWGGEWVRGSGPEWKSAGYWVRVGKIIFKCSTSSPHKKALAEASEEDLGPRCQIKRPKNECPRTAYKNTWQNMTSEKDLNSWPQLPSETILPWPSTKSGVGRAVVPWRPAKESHCHCLGSSLKKKNLT